MKSLRNFILVLTCFLSLVVSASLNAQELLYLTEFMAENDSTLPDEDGDFSDWIEIYNAGTNAVNLNGWYLTDNSGNLTKWRFPATIVAANSYLVVFASNKDRHTAGKELHTSFKLSSNPGYLALVKPDGTTVQSAYSSYPIQVAGVSYGFPVITTTTLLVTNGSPGRMTVPADDTLGVSWTALDFDDTSWTRITNGVGFEADAPSTGAAVQLANSVTEFSGNQGQNSWFYGYWNKKADPNGVYEMTDFTLFPRGTGNTLNPTNYWDGTKWDWPAGNPPWTELTSTGGHPNADNGNPALPIYWTIRRYVSETNGPLRITGTLACSGSGGTCGDGTVGHIFVDGVEVWQQAVFNTSLGYSIIVNASSGSIIDFAIDPGAAANDFCDTTTFTATIRTAGSAGTVADTMADWSETGKQNQGGWIYGYFIKTNASLAYATNRFAPFPNGTGPHSTANYWNGESWQWFEGDPPFDFIGQILCEPSIIPVGTSTNDLEHWVIRRWVSEISGAVTVDWHFAKKDLTGSGTTARVFHNGTQKDTITLTANDFIGSNKTVVAITNVQVGDFIDFTVEPGADVVGDICFLNATIHGSTTLSNQFRTDVGALMTNINSTAYLRIPFTVSNAAVFNTLTLRMKYDDGFIAYLNGTPVAGRNLPGDTNFNATAGGTRPDAQATQFEDFDLTRVRDLVQSGNNVLAIHGLNSSATDLDFLIAAELRATIVTVDAATTNYFSNPTPGSVNGPPSPNLGPLIANVQHTPHDPADNEDLYVTARVAPTLYPVATVRLYYRVQFGSESNIVMLDDGLHADGPAGDGVYGAVIPNTLSGPGQMVRYYITATATNNSLTRQPPFPHPLFSSQYFGAVVQNPSLTNALSVLHLFITAANLNSANNDNNGRYPCSLYWLGEFYDNVGINRHGQSSSGFPKKSYDVDFNADHHFRWDPNQERVDDINLLTTYPDKAHMRNLLAYETHRDAGSPYHYVVPVRVQTNGGFYGDWHIVENGDANFLKRIGRDPNGALYKMYNTFTAIGNTVIGGDPNAEKKTRKYEGNADLVGLYNGVHLSGGNLTAYMYDNLNISEIVNQTAARNLTADVDCCHKNYYFYRDTDGTGEWETMPWDVDLSFGRNWRGSCSCYWDDTMYADNYVQVGNNNSVWMAIFNTPATRQMYYRRLRTLMDELLQPTNTHPALLHYETRVNQLAAQIGPDGGLDLLKWGTWKTDVTGPIATNDPAYQNVRQASDVINTNYLPRRRLALYNRTAGNSSEIPGAQPTNMLIRIGTLDFNPASGNQAEEYLQLLNTNNIAVDISGWNLSGAIEHTFQGGVVMPASSTLYVVPDKKAFRNRAIAPRGGAGLYIEGPYKGQLSARGETIILTDKSGRVVTTNSYPGNPSLPQQYLRITEIMYHPPPPPPGLSTNVEEFEYIELQNIGPVAMSLIGVRLTNGIDFSFTGSSVTNLGPGESVLVVRNLAAFTSRYGGGLRIAGQYGGLLDNAGENIRLEDASGEVVLDFAYNNSWYPITDGPGASLVVVNPSAAWNTWGLKESWRPSTYDFGSPGQPDPVPQVIAGILVNEALTHTDPPQTDSIELYNPTTNAVNIGGWFITDDFLVPKKFRIPANTVISAGGYVVFTENDFNPTNPTLPTSFTFNSKGEEAYLFSGDTNTNLTGYFHGFAFGAAQNGVSFGRYVTSVGEVHFVAQSTNSLNATNAGPRVGPVVIAEIMFRPPDLPGNVDNQDDEYIELRNTTSTNVPLFLAATPTNTWQIRGGVDFVFPQNATLAAGTSLLLVSFDATNTTQAAAFRSKFGVPGAVPLYGPYVGKLDNSSDSVKLYRPDPPDTTDGFVPYILVDGVHYQDAAPWPAGADGAGASLQRLNLLQYGDDPVNWIAALPRAGTDLGGGTPPAITAQPLDQRVVAFNPATFSVGATGTAPLNYQWRRNGANVIGATNSSFTIGSVQLFSDAAYSVVVFNSAGAVVSSNALLSALIPAAILSQPQSRSVFPYNNVTFTVSAASTTPVSYQWRYNGVNIVGATNPSLTLTNIQPNQAGDYTVVVTDAVGQVASDTARLTVLLQPLISGQPQSRTNNAGSSVTLIVTASSSTPLRYQWFFNGTNLPGATNGSVVLANVQLGQAGTYYAIVSDSFGSVTSATASLTVLVLPIIGQEPQSRIVAVGANVILTTSAYGTLPMSFRWRKGSVNLTNIILNDTNATYTILNIRTNDAGIYNAAITNIAGPASRLTSNAYVTVVVAPTNQIVQPGTNVNFSVRAVGSAPIQYQWQFNGSDMAGATNTSLSLSNVQPADAGAYAVVLSIVTNVPVAPASFEAQLVVGADSDGDGIPDDWEIAHGLNPNDPADAALDGDRDGLTNLQEYIAGTEPGNPQSVLKLAGAVGGVAGNDAVTLSFEARPNKSYTVQCRDTLGTNGVWTAVTNITAAASQRTFQMTNQLPVGTRQRFYRIVTPMQP